MNCTICNLTKAFNSTFGMLVVMLFCLFSTQGVAQECVSDPSLLVKWDFTKAQECNGIVTNKFKHWKADVPLMTGGNQYCPQYNDGCGQAMIYEKGFGNTNDFKEAMCIAGFWRNGGNKYFTAPGYDHTSPDYNPDNPSGNIWINYNFLPGQVGSLSSFQYDFIQNGYRDGGVVAFEKWGVSVYRNGVRIYEETLPLTAANVNNSDNPLIVTFPNTADFRTDGSTTVLWEIAFALVQRNKSVRSGIDNLCIYGVKGQAAADVQATPATCESGGVDGQLEVIGFSAGEKYDFNQGSSYTGTATYATATDIPADGIIANDLPLLTEATEYSVRVFRADCYIDAVVTMPPVFCPYTCDFPVTTVTPNPASCISGVLQNDATIALSDITNMDRVGISSGQVYTGPDYAGAIDLGGALTYTFDSSNGVMSGTCTEYFTIRLFNGSEDPELCIVDKVVAISPVSCDGCQVICAELVGTDSQETNDANNLGQGEACKTDQKVDLKLSKVVDQSTGSNCDASGAATNFVFTVTVENVGDLAATDVTILDAFPDEMVIGSIVTSSGTPLEGFSAINWTLPGLAIGAEETMTVTASFVEAGAFQNCVEVKEVFPANDPDDTNDNACATVNVTGVNLPSIEKAFSPAFARANIPIRLSLKIFNNESGPIALTQDFVDNLPSVPGQMVVAATPNLTSALPGVQATAGSSQVVIPSGTVLQPGLNSVLVDVVAPANGNYVNIIAPGDLVTTACSNANESYAEVNIADENVIAPMLTKTFSNDMLAVGQRTMVTVSIENRNPESITLMADFSDELPTGLTVVGTPTSTCGGATTFGGAEAVGLSAGTVIAGNSVCTVEVEVEAIAAGFHCNRIPFNAVIVEVNLAGGGVGTSNEDVAEACLEVTNDPVFDLALRKTLAASQADTVAIGSTVTYDITVFNQGTEEARDIQIVDYISSDLMFVDDANWNLSGGNAELENPIASLMPGASITIPIQFTIDPGFTGQSITNFAEISSVANTTPDKDSSPDTDPDNDKGGLVMSSSDDVIFGDATMPGGAPQDANGVTDEDDADPAIVFTVVSCSMIATGTPSACQDADGNYYDLSGSIEFSEPPSSGSITISVDGIVVETLTAFTGPQAYTVEGLASDGGMHTVAIAFSADADCSSSFAYIAPEACYTPVVSGPCTTGEMGGSVFVDSNADGQNNDGVSSVDLSGIEVFIFGCNEDGASILIESVLTDADGSYSFTDPSIVNGEDYRIEFTNLPNELVGSAAGSSNNTDVQTVAMVSCNVNYGVIDPSTYCQPNPLIITPCYINGLQNNGSDVLVGLNYDRTGGVQHLALDNQMGPTWGIAYQRSTKTVFAAALLKRHVAFGPDGIDAIYMMDYSSPTGTGAGTMLGAINLTDDFGINVGVDPRGGGNSDIGGSTAPSRDNGVYQAVATVGLGDIDVSDDGNTLYVMNLGTSEVVLLDISDLSNISLIAQYPIQNPGCGTFRPWALNIHEGEIYIGGVCQDASTAYVLKYNSVTSQFDNILDFGLGYSRGCAYGGNNCGDAAWQPWVTTPANHGLAHAQPVFSDIEFDVDGSMILGFFDRYGHQTGFPNYSGSNSDNAMYYFFSAGDILRACSTGTGYAIEGSADCTYQHTSVLPPAGRSDGSLAEYYQDSWDANPTAAHDETPLGGLALLAGTNEVVSTVYDPIDFNTGGFTWFNNSTGLQTGDFEIYSGESPFFGKANGLGDIELLCDPAPIQIGNYAWIDENGDGVQDPCEEPLPGLTVKLYTKPATGDAALVATTTTSATGEYYFTNNTTAGESWEAGYTEVAAGDYFLVFCGESYDPSTSQLTVGELNYILTNSDSGMGSNFDLNDSDVSEMNVPGIGDLPAICITVEETNYSFDAGFINKPVVELADVDIACGPESEGGALFVTVEGGMEPFTYDWSEDAYDGMTEILNVPVGTYTVTVTDGMGCEIIATTEITIVPCQPNPCTGDNMGGTVFNDLDVDGINDGSGETGPEGIFVQIFECNESGASVLIDEAYTDPNGDYFFSNPTIVNGIDYRVEFSNIPEGYSSSIEGNDNGTETRYVDMVSCDVDYGIMDPSLLCEDNPLMVTNCYLNGTMDGGVIVSWNYNDSGLISQGRPAPTYQANNNQIGTTWGLAYHKISESAFTSAFLKRHSRLIDGDSDGNGDLGAIYNISMDGNPGNDNTPLWLDLDGATDVNGNTISVGTIPNASGRGILGNGPSNDPEAYIKVGKVGIGDIDLNSAHDELWAVNVFDKTLLAITINSDMTPGPIRSYDIPTDQCNGTGDDNDSRPFAVKYFEGSVYVGVVCSGENTNDLGTMAAYVYRLDDDGTSTNFTEVLSFDLDYNRDAPDDNAGCNTFNNWLPWSDVWPGACCCGGRTVYPQPILSDIEFNINTGEMLLGFIDRFGHQTGFQNYAPTGTTEFNSVSGGDVLKSTPDGDGTFTIESTISSGNEFYIDDFFDTGNGSGHDEIGLGGLAIIPGSTILVSTAYDPINGQGNQGVFISGGTIKFNNATGQKINNQGYQIFNGNDAGTFGKAAGLGDIELMCSESIIQLGNYVWVDTNGDGIQDPCEEPVEGLTVKLYTKPETGDAILVATTTTDADGEYYFTNNATTGETWETGYTEVELGEDYYIVFCGDSYNEDTEVITANGTLFSLTSENTGMGDNADFNDSDATEITIEGLGDLPAICVTADRINHSLDVGLQPKPDVALVQVLDPDYDVTGLTFGDSVKFKMVVTNQSLGSVDSIQVTNYIPAGFTFDETIAGNEGWTENSDGNPQAILSNGMASMEKDSACIYLTLEPSDDPKEWINVAEISAAYGNGELLEDCDSALNDDPEDNGGSEINTSADDYIDGDGTATEPDGVADTDQDNVDPATVPICDLSLINQIAEIPSTLTVGDTVKFEVIIENQGTVPATNIDIKYSIPDGYDYVSSNDGLDTPWDEASDCATATIDEVLGIGEKDTLCIYLTIDNVATEDVTEDSWTTFAEISAFEDPEEPGEDKSDVDSTPDSDLTNDSGGNPDDNTDNETGGDGSGDPTDPADDEDPELDEDDHDPAKVEICDAAVIIYTDEEGPFEYQDTIKFNVVVYNQGNGPITNIKINDFVGSSMNNVSTFTNTEAGWVEDNGIFTATLATVLNPGESDTICRDLQIVSAPFFDEDAYLQVVEIESFESPDDIGNPKEDIDSTPDNDPDNDPGGNPDDNTDNETDGDGSGDPTDPTEETNPTLDEDDNDPVLVEVFDLALKKVTVSPDQAYAPGDKVDFLITVYNQGNVDAANFVVTDYLADGFMFDVADNSGWTLAGDNIEYAQTATLSAGDSIDVSLTLTVVIPAADVTIEDWWNYAEISEADDNNDPSSFPIDADSTPDANDSESDDLDPGDSNDDEIAENGKQGGDEDDHDVAKVTVGYDLALTKKVQESGPYSYGDTLTYRIEVINQGGLAVSDVEVYDTIPCGLLYAQSLNADWTYGNNVATTILEGVLEPGMSTFVDIYMIVQRCATAASDNYYNVAEISDFKDEEGNEPNMMDIDSTPDEDPSDSDVVDDATGGPGDEDDHDPEDIEICDLALVNKIVTVPMTPKVGDTVKYEVIVYNQGNHVTNSVSIDYQIPNGLGYLDMNSSLAPEWLEENVELASIVTTEAIAPGEQDTVCIFLEIMDVATSEVTGMSWRTVAEITSYTNEDDETKTTDADSTPDDDLENDPGGNVDDETDNEINGDGTGDPEDPTEDSDPNLDEDDHDPAELYVCDGAVIINTDDEGPFRYGDEVKFYVEVHNQGNGPITNVLLQNLYGEGLEYIANTANADAGWVEDADGDLSLLITEVIEPSDTLTICLEMEVNPVMDPDSESWLQNVEIVQFEDPEDLGEPKHDVDSTPDDDPNNDPGGDPLDDTDDETNGDGTGDPEDPNEDGDPNLDEDDQDTELVQVFDLALTKTTKKDTVYRPGENVVFYFNVYNQGNVDATRITLTDYIPDGFSFVAAGNTGWSTVDDNLEYTHLGGLASGDSITVSLTLTAIVPDNPNAMDWWNYAEISAADNDNDSTNLDPVDSDSTPDNDPDNDNEVVPDDSDDDEYLEQGGPGEDEDDHDPERIIVGYDLALNKTVLDEGPYKYGDTLTYRITVYNQGGLPVTDVEIQDYLPCGLQFDASLNAGWTMTNGVAVTTIAEQLDSGEDTFVDIALIVQTCDTPAADNYYNAAEISDFKDDNGDEPTIDDYDSTPDNDPDNDEVVDEELGGPNDEDDHDPEDIEICDVALINQVVDLPEVVKTGDVIKYEVVLQNQSNHDVNHIAVDYNVPEGFDILASNVDQVPAWTIESDELLSAVSDKLLAPGEFDTLCLHLAVQHVDDVSDESWLTIAEITSYENGDGETKTFDADSTPDDDPTNDVGGNPEDETNDELDGDGTGDPTDPSEETDPELDEDDHDPELLQLQDLALIVWTDHKEPVKVGQDINFMVKVVNQGNITNEKIKVVTYLPSGFCLSENDEDGWVEESTDLVSLSLPASLASGEETVVKMLLKVKPGAKAETLIVFSEIESSVDEDGNILDEKDIDSTPDFNESNDSGGEPQDPIDCNTEPTIIVDDNLLTGDGNNGEDEDDHDPAWVQVYDLATIIYTNHTQPIIPGDEIKFELEVHNQGNMAAEDIELTVYVPDGFVLSSNDANGWTESGDNLLTMTHAPAMEPLTVDSLCLVLEVVPDHMLESLIPFVEISMAMDTLGHELSQCDIDSNSDSDPTNDIGGFPDSTDDDKVDGLATMGEDEDDHDPVVPPVLDLAIRIINTDDGPKVPGDMVKFLVTVYNQGSITPEEFTIENYVPAGLVFEPVVENAGWIGKGDNATYNYQGSLQPFESDSLCIFLRVGNNAEPLNVVDMVEIIEVIDEYGNDVSARDIDSVAEDSNENDKGNDLYSEEDNKIEENGRSGRDEDDHDQAFVLLCQEMICIHQVNISLDSDCESELTASMLMTGDLFPNEYYEFSIDDGFGNYTPITTLTIDHLGQQVIKVDNPICGNSCWTNVLVEYKHLPQIDCPMDMTLSCGALDMLPLPDVSGGGACNTDVFEIFLAAEVRVKIECGEPGAEEFTHRVTRTYVATDALGNTASCEHTIMLERIDLSGLEFPLNAVVMCSDLDSFIIADSGAPLPWLTSGLTGEGLSGVPVICYPDLYTTTGLVCPSTGSGTGIPLIPQTGATIITENGPELMAGDVVGNCSAAITYTDVALPQIGCTKKVLRTWEIREWYCSTEIPIGPYVQQIEIVDNVAPVVECPAPFMVTTNDDCAGDIDLPSAVTSDACDNGTNVVIEHPWGRVEGNGGMASLEVGTHVLTYKVSDDCGNSTQCTTTVTIRDNTEPVAICEQNTVVSISQNGNTIISSDVFDDGSWDECGEVTTCAMKMDDVLRFRGLSVDTVFQGIDYVEVSRMDNGCLHEYVSGVTLDGIDYISEADLCVPYIRFCCTDVGVDQMVIFRAKDHGGNSSDCMVNVEIQDKAIPSLTCPDDVTIDCRETYALDNLGLQFGEPVINDNCADTQPMNDFVDADINQCGIGTITRRFEVTDALGNVVRSCKQVITIGNDTPFAGDIEWPLDFESACGTAGQLVPEALDELFAYPRFIVGDDQCSLLGFDYDDEYFAEDPLTGECGVIRRSWTVIDWCNQVNGQFVTYPLSGPYVQTIKITNDVAPEIVAQEDLVFSSNSIDCQNGDIAVSRTAADDCTPTAGIDWSYVMTNSAGNVVEADADGTVLSGDTAGFSGVFAADTYSIAWTACDGCGNCTSTTQVLEVVNTKAPIPICMNGLSITLDNQGNAELWASDVDGGSYHPCGNEFTIGFNDTTSEQVLFFDCTHEGEQLVRLYLRDTRTGINDFCVARIEVQDPLNVCVQERVVVSGEVFTEEMNSVEDVKVEMAANMPHAMTNANGEYAFADMPMGGRYDIKPEKDTDYLNGVSTLDLILIQRHILGLEVLDSPYKMIAADVDGNKNINGIDLVELRKLILGIYMDLPTNDSWRFVDAGYEFIDELNPWKEGISENYEIISLDSNMDIDFIGVKVGDVNGSAETSSALRKTEIRGNRWPVVLEMEDTKLKAGEVESIAFYGRNYEGVSGWQTTFEFDYSKMEIVEVISKSLELTEANINLSAQTEGWVTVSYHNLEVEDKDTSEPLFELVIKAKDNLDSKNLLEVSSKVTSNEAYRGYDQIVDMQLDVRVEETTRINSINPNPWITETSVEFHMPESGVGVWEFYDVNGRVIYRKTGQYEAGTQVMKLRREEIEGAGIIYMKLTTDQGIAEHKMILVK